LLVTTFKILQLLWDLVPRPPNGASLLDPAGGLPSPRPPVVLPPSQTSFRCLSIQTQEMMSQMAEH